MQKATRSSIVRHPNERRLADAIEALHEKGPRLICELWDRIERLESERPDGDSEEARELAERLVAGLR